MTAELCLDPDASTKSTWDLLRERYPPGSHALFPEVRNATGFKGDRSADAVAMCLYPSQGLEVHGFEFKASRADWLRELKNPRKADGVMRFCDRWFLVASGNGIATVDELPITWGLMVSRKDGLRVLKQAPALSPLPLDRAFVASMCRAAQKQAESEVKKATEPAKDLRWKVVQEVRAEHAHAMEKETARIREQAEQQNREHVHMLKEFERLSGINLFEVMGSRSWRLGKVAAAVRWLSEANDFGSIERIASMLTVLAESARAAADDVRHAIPVLSPSAGGER